MKDDWKRARADRIIRLCEKARRRIAEMKKLNENLGEVLQELDMEVAGAGRGIREETQHLIAKMKKHNKRLQEALPAFDRQILKAGQDVLMDTPPLWYSEWEEKSKK